MSFKNGLLFTTQLYSTTQVSMTCGQFRYQIHSTPEDTDQLHKASYVLDTLKLGYTFTSCVDEGLLSGNDTTNRGL